MNTTGIRLNEKEREDLSKKAYEAGFQKVGTYLKHVASSVIKPSRKVKIINVADPSLVTAVNRCGVNINSIARRLNWKDINLPASELLMIGILLEEIRDELMEIKNEYIPSSR